MTLLKVIIQIQIIHSKLMFVVCLITKSFLTFLPIPAFTTISRPLSSSMCSIIPETANVGSSYNRMRGPGIGCWFSDRSNCSLYCTIILPLRSQWVSCNCLKQFALYLRVRVTGNPNHPKEFKNLTSTWFIWVTTQTTFHQPKHSKFDYRIYVQTEHALNLTHLVLVTSVNWAIIS